MYNIKCVSLRATASEYTCDVWPLKALTIAAGRAPACVAAAIKPTVAKSDALYFVWQLFPWCSAAFCCAALVPVLCTQVL